MRVTTLGVLDREHREPLYSLYLTALNPLLTQAAARHVLTRDEFEAEMTDTRIDKIVVQDDDDVPVAFTTLTSDLAAIAWVNPTYYREHFPDPVSRGAMFYLGYVLVDPERRRSEALALMAEIVNRRLAEAEGVIAFDICAFNVAFGVGRRTAEILHRAHAVTELDSQTYFAADFRLPATLRRTAGAPAAAEPHGPLRAWTLEERPALAEQLPALLDQLVTRAVHAVRGTADVGGVLARVGADQVLLLEDGGRLRGAAICLRLAWDADPENAPGDWDEALARGLADDDAGRGTTLVALPLVPDADLAGPAATGPLLGALRSRAATVAGTTTLLTPVRPVHKGRYPLIGLDEYLGWRTPEGPFDAAVRLHAALGGRVVSGTDAGQLTTAPRTAWAEALSLELPGDGCYVFDGGLAPLVVTSGTGLYREPRVWMAYDAATPRR